MKNILRTLTTSIFVLLSSFFANADIDSTKINHVILKDTSTFSNTIGINKLPPEWKHDPTNPDQPIPVFPSDPEPEPEKPSEPEIPVKYDVGTPKGAFNVSSSGAATYDMQIDLPDKGVFAPQIGISYNSQSKGYGLVGYGFNITGISSITRGVHDLFHDGKQTGVKYNTDDNLFIDGKRLILQTGYSGQNGATYTVEGDPFTKVIVHGNYTNSTATTWFEVITNSGMTYQYGNSPSSKIAYKNKSGFSRIASWYVNKVTDKYSNYITYEYEVSNLCIRPIEITYGTNALKNRGVTNKVSFTYRSLGKNARPFTIEDKKGWIDMCLSSITTSSNNSVYRKYTFTYDDNSDKPNKKWTRLISVQEENGNGDKLRPIKFDWHYLSSVYVWSSQLDVSTKDDNSWVEETGKQFLSADLNGDGISDIIRVAPVRIIKFDYAGHRKWNDSTYVYVSRSKVSSTGSVTYDTPLVYRLPSGISMDIIKSAPGGVSVMDFDGDGYNDIVFPFQNTASGYWNQVAFYLLSGSDVKEGKTGTRAFAVNLKATDKAPLFATFDVDGDGKDDVVCVEQQKKDYYYPCTIVQYVGGTALNHEEIKLTLPQNDKEIEKVFVGDYNNDGLSDLLLLYDGGYKIYFNNGGAKISSRFIEGNAKSGTNLTDNWRMQQGDFDGDGLVDFVCIPRSEWNIKFMRNNGDGTFDLMGTTDVDFVDKDTDKDDDTFALHVVDFDNDGQSDVFVSKQDLEYHGGLFRNYYSYRKTQIRWFLSNGSKPVLWKSIDKTRDADDSKEGYIFAGDFDGDGYIELANYGSELHGYYDAFNEKINIYKFGYNNSHVGKITSISDGLGNCNYIRYESAASPTVYKRNIEGTYPVNTYTIPLSVVSEVTSDNGIAGSQTTNYFYEDLRLHIAGRGTLGFNTVTAENKTLGTKEVNSIEKWDNSLWIPTETKSLSYVGNTSSSIISTYSVSKTDNNYFAYVSSKEITDLDGNKAITVSNYDTSKGVIIDETVKNDGDNMYKKVSYSGYQNKAGVWLPTILTMSQKHRDDPVPYTTVTTYEYDDKGNVLSSTINSGTNLELTTESTYDSYGNVLSTVSFGSGVYPILKYNRYDASGRFVVVSGSLPVPVVNAFTYDEWGNVLTENDITEKSNVLTTKYTYDGWGRKQTALHADGTQSVYETDWGGGVAKRYYIKESTDGKPTVTTWYDRAGHETLQETIGIKGIPISKTTTYNSKGQVSRVESKTGKLSITQSFTYDERGRVIADVSSSGRTTNYSYGNRSVTATTDGRSYTKITDAWGNIKTSIDPVTKVDYVYSSIGKPVEITTNGTTTYFKYDEAGNNISIESPDAGTIEYEYAADGKVLKMTDGRKITTTYGYDEKGRVVSKEVGDILTTNTYGTSGNSINLLVKSVTNGNSVEYTHDKLGRVITETHTINDNETYQFKYQYNDKNQLVQTTYPGDVIVKFVYDDYGYKTQTTVNDKVVCSVDSYDGLNSSSSFLNKYTTTQTLDNRGFNSSIVLSDGNNVLEQFKMNYEGSTGNLLSRKRNSLPEEAFTYDKLDRLDSVKIGSRVAMAMQYADNGNIISKTGVGSYYYDESEHPHAVSSIDNTENLVSSQECLTQFNAQNKISYIQENDLNMTIDYGPDEQRCFSVLKRGDNIIREITYLGDYEKVQEGSDVREFYYLDGNTIVIKENGVFKTYLAFTDNLGSILSVIDENGTKVFDASYDAWGKQTVTLNTIGLLRGYTGHEMLNEFNLINMNGRVYDPVLGRFLSPDKYVQEADNSQNYNSYSYCLNNPLKYTDPSGNLFGIDDVVIAFAVYNMASSMMQAAYEGKNIWKAGGLSLLSSALTYGVGEIFKGVGNFGHELLRAGAHGLASGAVAALDKGNFASAFISAAASSGIGSYAQSVNICSELMIASTTAMGGLVAWATGGDFLQGAMQGLNIGILNHDIHERKMYDRQLKKIYKAYLETSWRVNDNNQWEVIPANELCESIGGELSSIKDVVENSCAIRLSAALNAAGYDIPNIEGTMKGGDGKGYFLKAEDFNKYLGSKISPVKLINVISNPCHARNGLIYMYPGQAWQEQGITGHVDVVYRGVWASHAYYSGYEGGNPYTYRYKLNVFH